MKPLIIYHDLCPDGFGSAFAAWTRFGAEAEYLAATHGSYPNPDVAGRDVYILDFSFPREQLTEMYSKAKSLLLLDHHASAQEALADCPGTVFDMTRSGARMAWEHFNPGSPVPMLIQYIEDRDLWTWRLEGAADYLAYLDTLPFDFQAWATLERAERHPNELARIKREGAAMNRKFESLAKDQVKGAEPVRMLGIPGHKLNGGGLFTSKLGELMYLANGTFGFLWRIEGGQLRGSLRSKEGSVDVLAIAKHFGGGGHKAAAAFRIPLGTPEFQAFMQTYILGPGDQA